MHSAAVIFWVGALFAAGLLCLVAFMSAGWRRRALLALLIAILFTPTLSVGHGAALVQALRLVFGSVRRVVLAPDAMLDGLYPIAIVNS